MRVYYLKWLFYMQQQHITYTYTTPARCSWCWSNPYRYIRAESFLKLNHVDLFCKSANSYLYIQYQNQQSKLKQLAANSSAIFFFTKQKKIVRNKGFTQISFFNLSTVVVIHNEIKKITRLGNLF